MCINAGRGSFSALMGLWKRYLEAARKNSKKFKLAVDILKMKWYYKQAVADTTAKNTIRYHVLKIKKLKKLLDKDKTKWYYKEAVAEDSKQRTFDKLITC